VMCSGQGTDTPGCCWHLIPACNFRPICWRPESSSWSLGLCTPRSYWILPPVEPLQTVTRLGRPSLRSHHACGLRHTTLSLLRWHLPSCACLSVWPLYWHVGGTLTEHFVGFVVKLGFVVGYHIAVGDMVVLIAASERGGTKRNK